MTKMNKKIRVSVQCGVHKKKLTQRKMGFFGRLKHTKLILYVRAYIFIVLEIHNFELPCNHIWITIPRDCSGFELSSCNRFLFRFIECISLAFIKV